MSFFFQVIIFAMTSGQMWNHIRGPPVMHKNPQTGQIVSHYIVVRWASDVNFKISSIIGMITIIIGMITIFKFYVFD